MKNIHILPTDKTSRLQSNRYSKLFLSEVPKAYADCINQNIYITSNEEIISLSEINSLPLPDGKDIQTNMSNI